MHPLFDKASTGMIIGVALAVHLLVTGPEARRRAAIG
jgi:hypothetical protein